MTAQRETTTRHREVVLGVDGSAHNEEAIAWATAEAERSHCVLTIVSASDEYVRPIPSFSADYDSGSYAGHARSVVDRLTERLATEHPEIRTRNVVRSDDPAELVMDVASDADLIVVGKRGLGAFSRMIVGSTSIRIAGRAGCPTIVVPDAWTGVGNQPILVGVDVQQNSDAALAFAFDRAHALGVPLVAMYAWQTHPAVVLDDGTRQAWGGQAEDALREVLTGWQSKYPDVDVAVLQRHGEAAFALLEQAATCQLTVLGRHTASRRTLGFGFGSVTRAVLHHSTTPVAVIPES